MGAALEGGARSGNDQKIENEFRPKLRGFVLETQINDAIIRCLRSANIYDRGMYTHRGSVVLKGEGLESMLMVTVNDWVLRLCIGTNRAEQLQAGIEVHTVLMKKKTPIAELEFFLKIY